MKTMTVEQVMNLNPCRAYPESRVRELWQGKDALTLVEILRLPIPERDRIWVLTRPNVCDRDPLLRWVNDVADRAVRNHCLNCGNEVVEAWAHRWLDDTDRSYQSARAAADAAAFAAYAADAAAYAARAAADAAAERQAQIDELIAILEEARDGK